MPFRLRAQDSTATAAAAAAAAAQGATDGAGQGAAQSSASNVEMTSDSYKPVRRPPKRDAKRTMDEKQVDTFERQLACPCPCTLDVYTCRTTDFTCGISPAVHRDINALVEGGYSADEIMNALLESYGDFILMQPRKQGFNLLAWIAPISAIGIGAVAIGALLRRWRVNAAPVSDSAMGSAAGSATMPGVDATPEELDRLNAALRDDRR
jgi:cytochrome c-type biogenesis protein CcmH